MRVGGLAPCRQRGPYSRGNPRSGGISSQYINHADRKTEKGKELESGKSSRNKAD